MKTAFTAGIRHLAPARIVRAELRAIAEARAPEVATTVSSIFMRTLWAALVADHLERHGAAPDRNDCIGYRLLAEYLMGEAIDEIDRKLLACVTKSPSDDPLLAEARNLKRVTDTAIAEDAARGDIAVEELLALAHRHMRSAQ
jgi:hypothetical protein